MVKKEKPIDKYKGQILNRGWVKIVAAHSNQFDQLQQMEINTDY